MCSVTLLPAGHILGGAQVVMEHGGARAIVSGDFKRRRDPTCAPFEPMSCDLFVTEATFGLPVFRHPSDAHEIGRLLRIQRRSIQIARIWSASPHWGSASG